MSNFRVGQRVVCVDDTAIGLFNRWSGEDAIREGQIYTVRSVHLDERGILVLWLDEVSRTALARARHGDMVGYRASRFRPVVERKSDISIFKAMLNQKPAGVDA